MVAGEVVADYDAEQDDITTHHHHRQRRLSHPDVRGKDVDYHIAEDMND